MRRRSDLAPISATPIAAPLTPSQTASVQRLVDAAWSANTRRVYRWGWGVFAAWCEAAARAPLPADALTVAAFVGHQAEHGVSAASISLQLAAIGHAHEIAHLWSPTRSPEVRLAVAGARRLLGTAPTRIMAPLALDHLEPVIEAIDRTTPEGIRDAAILLVGFASALRRSNLAALTIHDVSDTPGGLALAIRRSKTDQEGAGEVIGIAAYEGSSLCPVAALRAWIAARGVGGESLFGVSDRTIYRVVKRRTAAAGLPPLTFGAHSLRAGFVTEALRQRIPDAAIMGTTLHKTPAMLARYRREADPVARGASGALKLPRKPTSG